MGVLDSVSVRRGVAAILIAPFIVLLLLFIFDISSFQYVWLHGDSDLPLAYRISALWAGREGPLLLWVALLGGLLLLDGKRHDSESEGQHRIRLGLLVGFAGLLLAIAMYLQPFRPTPAGFTEWMRPGLNALLQTDLMVIHPPVVFTFYTLCIGVGLHAVTAMLTLNDGENRASLTDLRDRIMYLARPALFVGTLGVGLGGLWAYTVLDWGGYWAWDPVETGSLLPWLALVILLHLRLPKATSAATSDSGRWVMALGVLPAFFAIHATLVTRANGVWASVHAFVTDGTVEPGMGPVQRVLAIGISDGAGVEVHLYLLLLGALMVILLRTLAGSVSEGTKPVVTWGMPVGVLTVGALAGLLLDSVEVGLLTGAFGYLLWSRREDGERWVWIVAGVALMLFASWAFLLSRTYAITGMILFLLPWLLQRDDGSDESSAGLGLSSMWQRIKQGKTQISLVIWTPLAVGGPFLLLTWLLLLAEVDGASLAWHELYGTPLLALVAVALTVYSWRKVLPSEWVPWVLIGVFCTSLLIAVFAGEQLPGDSDHQLTDSITRGALAGFVLPFLILSLPAMAHLVWTRLRAWGRAREGSTSRKGNRRKAELARLRASSMHIAHLGILLLIIGHVYTTTLVERGHPSHVVMLPQDTPIEYAGYTWTYTDISTTAPGSDDWDYAVGDGALITTIEVVGSTSETTLHPGVVRFDSGSIPARSETDVWHRWNGDLIVIFDYQQATGADFAEFMAGDGDVEKIRVTIYDLRGSHMVWVGWVLILIGSCLNWVLTPKAKGRDTKAPTIEEE